MLSPTSIVSTIKSITSREIYIRYPKIREKLWGGNLWSSGYFVSTVGKHGNEEEITKYVRNQRKNYDKLYRGKINENYETHV